MCRRRGGTCRDTQRELLGWREERGERLHNYSQHEEKSAAAEEGNDQVGITNLKE